MGYHYGIIKLWNIYLFYKQCITALLALISALIVLTVVAIDLYSACDALSSTGGRAYVSWRAFSMFVDYHNFPIDISYGRVEHIVANYNRSHWVVPPRTPFDRDYDYTQRASLVIGEHPGMDNVVSLLQFSDDTLLPYIDIYMKLSFTFLVASVASLCSLVAVTLRYGDLYFRLELSLAALAFALNLGALVLWSIAHQNINSYNTQMYCSPALSAYLMLISFIVGFLFILVFTLPRHYSRAQTMLAADWQRMLAEMKLEELRTAKPEGEEEEYEIEAELQRILATIMEGGKEEEVALEAVAEAIEEKEIAEEAMLEGIAEEIAEAKEGDEKGKIKRLAQLFKPKFNKRLHVSKEVLLARLNAQFGRSHRQRSNRSFDQPLLADEEEADEFELQSETEGDESSINLP